MQWVKVDQSTINHYWQLLRGVAIGTVNDEFVNFGRGGKRVEVGVISLGTTTTDGNRREVCKRWLQLYGSFLATGFYSQLFSSQI